MTWEACVHQRFPAWESNDNQAMIVLRGAWYFLYTKSANTISFVATFNDLSSAQAAYTP